MDATGVDVTAADGSVRDEAAIMEFVHHFGTLLQGAGMPGITAHVFGLLLADPDGRMTAAEIGGALGVSPAAVSTATSYLSMVGLTRKVREPGSRRLTHALVGEDWYSVLATRNDVVGASQQLLARASVAAGGRGTEAGRRLWLDAEMFAYLGQALQEALTGWEQRRAELLADADEPG